MTEFFTHLSATHQLGKALRNIFPSWRIVQLNESWSNQEWVREILHRCDKGTLVYAATHIPEVTFKAYQTEFERLGSRSIGDHFLFLRSDVRRSPFTCKIISEADSHYSLLTQHLGPEAQFYERQSTFTIGEEHPLCIKEYFGKKALMALGITPT